MRTTRTRSSVAAASERPQPIASRGANPGQVGAARRIAYPPKPVALEKLDGLRRGQRPHVQRRHATLHARVHAHVERHGSALLLIFADEAAAAAAADEALAAERAARPRS